jgi:hypothetical protein
VAVTSRRGIPHALDMLVVAFQVRATARDRETIPASPIQDRMAAYLSSLRSGDREVAGMADGAVAVRAQCGDEPRASSIEGASSAPRLTIFLAVSLRN